MPLVRATPVVVKPVNSNAGGLAAGSGNAGSRVKSNSGGLPPRRVTPAAFAAGEG